MCHVHGEKHHEEKHLDISEKQAKILSIIVMVTIIKRGNWI
jgi:hypothetical protein